MLFDHQVTALEMAREQLVAHIQLENKKTQEWMDEAEGRWGGMIVEDIKHWSRDGINSVAQYEHYMMSMTIWDLYKNVNGIRPRWMDFDSMTMAEMESTYDSLVVELNEQIEEDEIEQKEAIVSFENKVVELINSGADDRETAVRWLREGEQDEQLLHDDNFFEYANHLPYGYMKQAVS